MLKPVDRRTARNILSVIGQMREWPVRPPEGRPLHMIGWKRPSGLSDQVMNELGIGKKKRERNENE